MALRFSAFDAVQSLANPHVRGFAILSIVLVLALTACDEEERRAVAPGVVSDLATATADDHDEEPVEEPDQYVSPLENGVLDISLPRAERVYFAHGGDIWQVSIDEDPAPVVTERSVTDLSPSATGHRLAVLGVERGDDETDRATLSLLLPDGNSLIDIAGFDEHLDSDLMSPVESIALSPAGNTLALAHQNGAVTSVTLDGSLQVLAEPAAERRPGTLHWSSDGRFISLLDPWLPNEPSSLYVLVPETGVRQILVRASPDGHGVVQARWIPGTSYLVYTKASGSTIPLGGDIFLVNALTGQRQLLLSSGQIAPVAGAVDLAVSPDGETVAFTAFVPGDERPAFAGLWTIDLSTGDLERVQVNRGYSVTDVWWLGDNLLYRLVDRPRTKLPGAYTGLEQFSLVEYDLETGTKHERMTTD